jgi:hypothetical protein
VVQFRKTLHEYLEFPEDHFLELGESLQHAPEFTTFWDQLGVFLGKPIGTNDLLFFYFTGHGFRHDQKTDYLLPRDASLNNLKRTGIAVEDVVEDLVESKCKNIVMFLDACRNPVKRASPKGVGMKGIGEQSAEVMAKNEVLCFFSCQPQEQSWEIEKLEHSSFTYCLLEAIRRAKCTTAAELDKYLLDEVPLLNKKYNADPQKPYSMIVPTERGQLPILASKVKGQQETVAYGHMIQSLWDLHLRGLLDERCYEVSAELLVAERDKERELSPIENMKLNWIKKLYSGRVKLKIFKETWELLEKQKPPESGAVT